MLRSICSIMLSCLLMVAVTGCTNSETVNEKPASNNVFATVDYDKAVAYEYDGEGGTEIIDLESGQLAGKISKEKVIEKEQVTRLTKHLCDPSSYGDVRAACFDPHLGIVFYKAQKPVASISICLDCNYLLSSLEIPGARRGFSGEGVKGIMDFEKQIGFETGN